MVSAFARNNNVGSTVNRGFEINAKIGISRNGIDTGAIVTKDDVSKVLP
jgi:hypothetical protein